MSMENKQLLPPLVLLLSRIQHSTHIVYNSIVGICAQTSRSYDDFLLKFTRDQVTPVYEAGLWTQ